MCGLVAIINKLNNGFNMPDKDNFADMLYADAIRGMDSTGAFLVDNLGNLSWGKTKHNPVHLFITKEWDNIMDAAYKKGTFLVGHNRKATVGKVTDNTAHPFVEKNIILVHNGTLTNHKDIGDTEVDSHAICKSIANKGHLETIKTLQGAFALIWYDINLKSLFVCRNDKRPLSFVETTSAYYLSSEVGLTKWMLSRNSWSPKIITETDIKVGYLYEFPVDNPEEYTETLIDLHKIVYTPNLYDWKKKTTDIVPVTTTTTTTTLDTSQTITYQLGQYVPISIKNYNQFLDNTISKIIGVVENDQNIKVEMAYSEELLVYLTEEDNLIGRIKQISYNQATKTKTLILYEDSITSGTITQSLNNTKIATPEWTKEVGHCSNCNKPIDFNEIPLIKSYKKNKKYINVCTQCSKNLTSIRKLKNVLQNNLVRVQKK